MDLEDFRSTYYGMMTLAFAGGYVIGFLSGVFGCSSLKQTLSESDSKVHKKISENTDYSISLGYTGLLEYMMYNGLKQAPVESSEVFVSGLPAVTALCAGAIAGLKAEHHMYKTIWINKLKPRVKKSLDKSNKPVPCEFPIDGYSEIDVSDAFPVFGGLALNMPEWMKQEATPTEDMKVFYYSLNSQPLENIVSAEA